MIEPGPCPTRAAPPGIINRPMLRSLAPVRADRQIKYPINVQREQQRGATFLIDSTLASVGTTNAATEQMLVRCWNSSGRDLRIKRLLCG